MVDGLQRVSAPQRCVDFYQEHVEADAVHEQVVRTDVIGSVLRDDPGVTSYVVLGIRTFRMLEERLATQLMSSWKLGRTSLNCALN